MQEHNSYKTLIIGITSTREVCDTSFSLVVRMLSLEIEMLEHWVLRSPNNSGDKEGLLSL